PPLGSPLSAATFAPFAKWRGRSEAVRRRFCQPARLGAFFLGGTGTRASPRARSRRAMARAVMGAPDRGGARLRRLDALAPEQRPPLAGRGALVVISQPGGSIRRGRPAKAPFLFRAAGPARRYLGGRRRPETVRR